MKYLFSSIVLLLILSGSLCINANNNDRKKVLLETEYGNVVIELYNETPLHRDNFLKLTKEGFFNELLFHRVINNFMIQGGDPNSKGAEAGKRLGGGGPGYQIPAEINPEFYHKKGALSAARKGDQGNPERKSSGSQFYIVHGTIYTSGQLDTMEIKMNYGLQQNIMRKYFTEAQDELNKYRQENNQEKFNLRVAEIRAEADSAYNASDKTKIPENRRKDYSTIGGYPSLDGAYTVFGQVIKGLEVIDKIAAVKTDKNNRPLNDIEMTIKVIE